jgi:hypothetical protein
MYVDIYKKIKVNILKNRKLLIINVQTKTHIEFEKNKNKL